MGKIQTMPNTQRKNGPEAQVHSHPGSAKQTRRGGQLTARGCGDRWASHAYRPGLHTVGVEGSGGI